LLEPLEQLAGLAAPAKKSLDVAPLTSIQLAIDEGGQQLLVVRG
jgi:hypothetical protein